MKVRWIQPALVLVLIATGAFAQSTPPATPPAAPSPAAGRAPVPIPRQTFISQMDTAFNGVDSNRDGKVDQAEIVAAQKRDLALIAAARAQAMFKALDTDGNGQLTPAEFAKVGATAATPDPRPYLGQFDANKDGIVTLIEHRTATQANFDRIDADKDGIVSIAEMKAAGIIK